jgi:glycosyltransferase involved in cell wall biosynthesis
MKIGIEAQRLFRKKKHGMDIVALEMIKALQQLDTVNQYFIFVKADEDNQVIKDTGNFKIISIEGGPYPYWEQVLLPKAANHYSVDILHCTSNTAPLKLKMPLVVTLHDIIYLEKLNLTKGTWYQRIGNLYRRWNVPRVVKRSSRLITVSDYERDRILSHFRLRDEQVDTVYNGVGKNFQPQTEQSLQNIKKKYNLPDNYVFFLGNTDPKKNVEGVLKALSHLRKRNALNFKLLMLDIDRDYLQRMANKIGDETLMDSIAFSGYVPNQDLPAIYAMAKLFLYPSLRESFGIPILEAMACGTPVITSNTSSMPEVAGDAAHYIDPFNPDGIAMAIEQILNNPSEQQSLRTRGLDRVRNFRWENNARKVLEIYQQVNQN